MNRHYDDNEKCSSGCVQKLKELLHKSDNRTCADCSAPDPKWASTNIGVFICSQCCKVHRTLGAQISQVLSVTSHEWSNDEVDAMIEVGGNTSANSIYEDILPEGYSKPKPAASSEERAKFIRSKYELQEFVKPSLRIVSSKCPLTSSNCQLDSDISEEGLVEHIGALKVKVIQGRNLAIRDILTSDPYVVLTLAQQRTQTAVIQSNLNPIWNEEFKLLVPQQYRTLKLQVFDHDKLFVDDTMGDAEITLQPIITAAMMFGDAELLRNIQIGKWLKSSDNALVNDSIIKIDNGKVKQEILLKLQHVESGEILIELEWIPLNHTKGNPVHEAPAVQSAGKGWTILDQ